ncbi:MAG: hypothetical protein V4436_02190 [Patescibacteria group bacterium]
MAKLTIEKKKKLQKLLGVISTPDEKAELQRLDALKVKEIVEFFEGIETENEEKIDKLEKTFGQVLQSFDGYRKASSAHSKYLVETFGNFSDSMIKKIGELGGTITTSYEKNKPINAAGVYKDMINQLSTIDKSIKDKPVPVWNWPQYASVGVRNKNFSNINPSTEEAAEFSGGYNAQKITIINASKIAYIATATPGSAYADPQWQACRIDYSDITNIRETWANGNQDFTNVATDLTVLTYS